MSEVAELKQQIAALRAEMKKASTISTTPTQSVLPQIPLPGPLKIRDGDISEILNSLNNNGKTT